MSDRAGSPDEDTEMRSADVGADAGPLAGTPAPDADGMAPAVAAEDDDEDDDDLFGGGGADSDAGSEVQVKTHRRNKNRLASESGSEEEEAAPRPSKAQARLASLSPDSSLAADSEEDRRRARLEYREDDGEGDDVRGGGAAQAEEEERIAHLSLPQVPVRRTKPHYVARLPNFLNWQQERFDRLEYHPDDEDKAGGEKIVDPGLRSLLKTDNTVRWRWAEKRAKDGTKVAESNARIIRWSDGSMSLQLGSELFDVGEQREGQGMPGAKGKKPIPSTQLRPTEASQTEAVSSQAVGQSFDAGGADSVTMGGGPPRLTYLSIPYRSEEVIQVEQPIAGTLTFRPTDLKSETHRKLAQAVKHHRTTKIGTADLADVDPEAEKLAREKEFRDQERKRRREELKKLGGREDDEEDFADFGSKRKSRLAAARARGGLSEEEEDDDEEEEEAMDSDEDGRPERGARGKSDRKTRGGALDDFVVDDDTDDEMGAGKKKAGKKVNRARDYDESDEEGQVDEDEGMDVDEEEEEEEDEMDIADRKIEEAEAAAKAQRKARAKAAAAGGGEAAAAETTEGNKEGAVAPKPKRAVLDESDDDE